jgi:hypothetical protein
VSLKTFFENTLREEAEQMKGALNVVIVVPPPRPIPIILLVLVEVMWATSMTPWMPW